MTYFNSPSPNPKGRGLLEHFTKMILTMLYSLTSTTALAPSPLRERAGVRVNFNKPHKCL